MAHLRCIHDTKTEADDALTEIEALREEDTPSSGGDPWATPRQIEQGEYEGKWEYAAPPEHIRDAMERDLTLVEYDDDWYELETIT